MPKIDKTKIARYATKFVVSTSVRFVVTNAVKSVCPVANQLQIVERYIGSFALGSMAAAPAERWADQTFDEVLGFAAKVQEQAERS